MKVLVRAAADCGESSEHYKRAIEYVSARMLKLGFRLPPSLSVIITLNDVEKEARVRGIKGKQVLRGVLLFPKGVIVRCSKIYNVTLERLIRGVVLYVLFYNTHNFTNKVVDEIARKIFFDTLIFLSKTS